MEARAQLYVPYIFRSFQGYTLRDIKEHHVRRHMQLILERDPSSPSLCNACGCELGHYHDRYRVEAKHLRAFDWTVSVSFFREKRFCSNCNKVRSEMVPFLCPTSPHITMELAWWINRLSEITTVLQVAKLESIDKMSCYKVDKQILLRLLQGYEIPKVTHISVDEVYARSAKQQKDHENRDDLFLTVIVDHRTHKVIWVSQSRSKEALDTFFAMIGPEQCKKIQVVSCDQHKGYAQSVAEHCPNADLIWDKFHLVQGFNEALNEERRLEWEKKHDPEADDDLLAGKYRYIFLTKAKNRSKADQWHMKQIMGKNMKIAYLEVLKEHFHRVFDEQTEEDAMNSLCRCYEWACEIKAKYLAKYLWSLIDRKEFTNYFRHRLTSGVSEGINRAIKTLKWVAYGYKDMIYFALKIMQKHGYLNHKYALEFLYNKT